MEAQILGTLQEPEESGGSSKWSAQKKTIREAKDINKHGDRS